MRSSNSASSKTSSATSSLLSLFGIGPPIGSSAGPSRYNPASSSPASSSSSSSGPTFVHIRSTPIQSHKPLVEELAKLASEKGENVIVVTAEHRGRRNAWPDGVAVVSAYQDACRAEFDDDIQESRWSETAVEILKKAPRRPNTVLIENLDSLLDICSSSSTDRAHTVYRRLLSIIDILDGSSKFIFGSVVSSHSLRSKDEARLVTLLSSRAQSPTSSSGSSSYLTVQLHPPATFRHLLSSYGSGLRPASTTSQIARKLRDSQQSSPSSLSLHSAKLRPRTVAGHSSENTASEEKDSINTIFDWDAPPWRETDVRIWNTLSQVTSQEGLFNPSWWNEEVDLLKNEELEAIRHHNHNHNHNHSEEGFDPIEHRITLADLLSSNYVTSNSKRNEQVTNSNRSRIGWGLISCQTKSTGNKFNEEILGCCMSSSNRFKLVPLEMGDYRSAAATATQDKTSKQDSQPAVKQDSSSLLPFNLSLTSEQRERRNQVELPFQASENIYQGVSKEEDLGLRRGTTGQSVIYFNPDSADEEDEEDPDDDLDI
ncbi:unnamed protein product [Sympodiomycopsis kandeliae]